MQYINLGGRDYRKVDVDFIGTLPQAYQTEVANTLFDQGYLSDEQKELLSSKAFFLH